MASNHAGNIIDSQKEAKLKENTVTAVSGLSAVLNSWSRTLLRLLWHWGLPTTSRFEWIPPTLGICSASFIPMPSHSFHRRHCMAWLLDSVSLTSVFCHPSFLSWVTGANSLAFFLFSFLSYLFKSPWIAESPTWRPGGSHYQCPRIWTFPYIINCCC